MITEQLLLKNGYREFELDIFHINAANFFQKRFRNEKGQTKYFISFYKYKHSDREDNYEVELQFQKEKYTMNIKMFAINNMSIDEIEHEVYKIWWELDCKYYDYGEEYEKN